MTLSPEFTYDLQRAGLEVRLDPVSKLLYSTDASIYQIEPLGVAFPHHLDELSAAVELAARYRVPVLARGAGSSQAGQAIGPSLILDCSRYLDRILAIDPQARTAVVEPGVVLNDLNRAAARHGLMFGPDPASGERATLGGSLANNATGAHSIQYGMCADHLLEAQVVLSDGSAAQLGAVSLAEAERRASGVAPAVAGSREAVGSREAALYLAALEIRSRAELVQAHWPRTWRRASGYNLNYLLPWSPGVPPAWSTVDARPYPPVRNGEINLASLVAGSEGTLAVIRTATVALMPRPAHTALGVIPYPNLPAACADAPALLEHWPSAIELIPGSLIELARSVPAYAGRLGFMDELPGGPYPAAMLVVEFAGDDPRHLVEQVRALGRPALLADTPAAQKQVWEVRKMGLGIVSSRPGDLRAPSFIDDLSVPVEKLAEFVVELERILHAHGSQADFFGHASAGCMHLHPLINLKTAQGVDALKNIARAAAALTIRLGGSVSGEHGDGISRAGWLPGQFGPEVMAAFRQLKQAADPYNLLNPGKILDAPPIDSHPRYGAGYRAQAWAPVMDFTRQGGAPGEDGLIGAVDMCNGAGVCRKSDGVMCPSFQATREEMHSTRGRANLLRALMSGRFPTQSLGERAVYEALDLCLACKGCKAECPSAVDMAKLKYEFNQHYYRTHPRRWRDYLFAYIDRLAPWGSPFAGLANFMLRQPLTRRLAERALGLAHERVFPAFAGRPFQSQARSLLHSQPQGERVFLLLDAFTEFFYPAAGLATVRLLMAAGCRVEVLPLYGAGRTLISKGFLEPARQHAAALVDAIARLDPQGRTPVVGIEPSEIYTLRDEFPELLSGNPRAAALAGRAWMVDEFLLREGDHSGARLERLRFQAADGARVLRTRRVRLHGHCYQKAQPPAVDGLPVGVAATVACLQKAGYAVEVIESGCCGMAGAFGYEAEHYAISQQIAEQALLPAVRAAGAGVHIAAAGVSCQSQIKDGAGREARHPVELLSVALLSE